MIEVERVKLDRRIEQLYRSGIAPSNIAEKVTLRTERVRAILLERGFTLDDPLCNPGASHSPWDITDPNKLRLKIWDRARRAARAARQAAA